MSTRILFLILIIMLFTAAAMAQDSTWSLPLPTLKKRHIESVSWCVPPACSQQETLSAAEQPVAEQPSDTVQLAAAPPPVVADPPVTEQLTDPPAQSAADQSADQQWDEVGNASWYGGRFQGRQTANGEIFDTDRLTAAHRTLPFNTIVQVRNPQNDQSVLVRINDRGPFVEDRIIDLSRAAATQIDIAKVGVAPVQLKIVRLGQEPRQVTIQLGAFAKYANAIDLIRNLERDGFVPQVESVNDSLFRVVLINVDRTQLDAVQQQLVRKGYVNMLVRSSRRAAAESE